MLNHLRHYYTSCVAREDDINRLGLDMEHVYRSAATLRFMSYTGNGAGLSVSLGITPKLLFVTRSFSVDQVTSGTTADVVLYTSEREGVSYILKSGAVVTDAVLSVYDGDVKLGNNAAVNQDGSAYFMIGLG